MKKIERVESGLRVDMPHKVIDYRIVDVLEALDKRLTAMEDGGSDDEVHEKPLSRCEGCVRWPCETSQILKGDSPRWKPPCYREEKTCDTCTHALALDKYDDILCLRASVWQHPRFESPDSTDCDHHHERETP